MTMSFTAEIAEKDQAWHLSLGRDDKTEPACDLGS
jgi:hypothetical protein